MIYVGRLTSLASGYAVAALNHLGALVQSGYNNLCFAPARYGCIPWMTFPTRFDCLRRLPEAADRSVVLIHDTIDQLSCTAPRTDIRLIGLTALDMDRCPKWAAVGVNTRFNRLIVPSEHSKRAAITGGVTIPVYVVPHCVHREHWETSLPAIDRKGYVFYSVGSWNPRKNPEAVVRAYCRAFKREDSGARLYLKITGPDSQVEQARAVVEEECGGPRSDVVVTTQFLDEKGLREVHAYGDCYVSACRGAAFDIAVLEAALLGKPVISTAWSGPAEYLSAERGDIMVPFALKNVFGMDAYVQFSASQQWADPAIDDLSAAMVKVFSEKRREAAVAKLREMFCWEANGPIFRAALGV